MDGSFEVSGFDWERGFDVPALVCRPLAAIAPHVFTTRQWALGASASETERAWADVAAALRVEAGCLRRPRQVHGAAVVRAEDAAAHPDADIIVAGVNASRLAVAIQVADCVPLLIADERTGAVAAAHAGWRGLAARVPAIAVEALTRDHGCRARDLVAAAGPSVGACCYEVGDEVRGRFLDAGFAEAELARWFSRTAQPTTRNPSMRGLHAPRSGHWYFDGWSCTRDQLTAAGVTPDRIHVAELCTASHPSEFCSYRRDGQAAGRMAAAIRCRTVTPFQNS